MFVHLDLGQASTKIRLSHLSFARIMYWGGRSVKLVKKLMTELVVRSPCGAAHQRSNKETVFQPQRKKCYNAHQSPNTTRYIAGVGPLNNIKREAPIIPPIMYRRM